MNGDWGIEPRTDHGNCRNRTHSGATWRPFAYRHSLIISLVLRERIELSPYETGYAPQAYVAANYTTATEKTALRGVEPR
jgi:hypothetical protein